MKDMNSMFYGAYRFTGDVSKVEDMNMMFHKANKFRHKLYTKAWVHSKTKKEFMFRDSMGSI